MVGATAGGISTFNIQHGYVEALVRGFRLGFLDDVDYHHLTQCESLEGTTRERLLDSFLFAFLSGALFGNDVLMWWFLDVRVIALQM